VREAEGRGELRAEEARAKDPDRYVEPAARHRVHTLARLRLEVAHQLDHVLRELVDVAGQAAPERPHRDRVGARGTAEAQLDAARVERGEGAELLGDDE